LYAKSYPHGLYGIFVSNPNFFYIVIVNEVVQPSIWDMLKRWKKIRQEFEIKNPWWTYRKDEVLLPNGRLGEYHFVHVIGSSMIIPIRDDGKLILVNQYRYLLDRESLEFPCEETAEHELAEETGFHAKTMEIVGEHNPYNGVTNELSRVYIARNLVPTEMKHDDTEEFEQVLLTVSELENKIAAGEVWDGMSLASWSLARRRMLEILAEMGKA